MGGPMSVADYMQAVVRHPKVGYYMQGDVFGAKGDFTTSPEVSPLFGEMLGAWACHELSKIGSIRPLQLVELGPGRGTLAADILRVFRKIPPGPAGVSLHLVEISERLAQLQAARLGIAELTTHLPESSPHYQEGTTEDDIKICWYDSVENLPRGFSIFLANEFFDALPIHKFQRINGQWREILIALKNPGKDVAPEFDFALSPKVNSPHCALIDGAEKRDHVEVCPEGIKTIDYISNRLEEDGGFALIVDYGHMGDKTDTFRAFKNHALHNPLEDPGTADLTADVDFSFLIRTAGNRVLVNGPTPQGVFLQRLGIHKRLNKLVTEAAPEQAKNLQSGVKMVVEDMGNRFLCLALFPAVLADYLHLYPAAGFNAYSENKKNQ